MTPSPQIDPLQAAEPGPHRSDRPVAVVAPMADELAGIRKRSSGSQGRLEIGAAHTARFGDSFAVLSVIGEGPGNAARATGTLLDSIGASAVVVVGVAGGLTPDMPAGALLVAREVRDGDLPAPAPDLGWLARIPDDAGVYPGTIVSRGSMLCTRESKASARALFGAGDSAAVDLETAAVARVAAQRGVPYIAVRAISDTAGESLPLDFNRFRDASGRIDRIKVARHALLRPGLIAPLWRLRRRVALCTENLARLIVPLLEGENR
jgi:adenosylhomocysteine nucleosidase